MNNLTSIICEILISRIGKQNRIGIERILGQLDVLNPNHNLTKSQLYDIIDDIRSEGLIERLIYVNRCYYVSNNVEELRRYIGKYDNVTYLEMTKIIELLKEQVEDYEKAMKEFN